MKRSDIDPGRRAILLSAGGLAAAAAQSGTLVGQATAAVPAESVAQGRRKLGTLEVSSLGVQKMSRTYQTTIPNRAEMHGIIRAAFDRGVTGSDAAEAYGPFEVERILGEGGTVPRQARDRDQVRLEHRPRYRQAPSRP